METIKAFSLTKGDDSFRVSGRFNDQESITSLIVSLENTLLNKKSEHNIDLTKNKEMVEVFIKLSNNMYWDIEQVQEDISCLTELVSQLIIKSKPTFRVPVYAPISSNWFVRSQQMK